MNSCALSDVVTIVGGGTPSRGNASFYQGTIPWVTVKDLDETFFIDGAKEHISADAITKSATRLIPSGSVLMGTRMAVGRPCINRVPVAINQDLKALLPSEAVHPLYLTMFLSSIEERLNVLATGATVKGINVADLEEIEIPLPPLPEQRRIAAQLEQADRLRRTRRYTLDLSDTFLPATFRRMFGDGDQMPAPTVEELLSSTPNAIRTGPFGSQLLHSEFTESGVAVLGIDNAVNNNFEWDQRRYISEAKYEALKRYTVRPGDVIITIMGTCGRCAVVPDDIPTAINTKHLCCITLDQQRCLPIYLHAAFLHHPFVRHQLNVYQKGAIMDGLNMEIIRNLRIPLPPLAQQRAFAAIVAQHERLRATQRESLRQAEHLFQTLLHRAFAP